jgi:DNA repair protein RadC
METPFNNEHYKVGEVKLSYKVEERSGKFVTSSESAKKLFDELYDNDYDHIEKTYVLGLSRNNEMVSWMLLGVGGISGVVMDVRIILQFALLTNSSAIILSHNHPSGNQKPSRQDNLMTEKIKRGCEAVEITLLDHLILTSDGYYSYSDSGKL